jgi:hypothetical protein
MKKNEFPSPGTLYLKNGLLSTYVITMLGTILMHALWRKVVLFIIKIMKKSIIPILKLKRVIHRIV